MVFTDSTLARAAPSSEVRRSATNAGMSSGDAHEVWLPGLLPSRKITTNSRLGWHPLWLFDLLARMRDLLGSCVRADLAKARSQRSP